MPGEVTEPLDNAGSLIIHRARGVKLKPEAPLVLFFSWLDAPNSALQKYIKLYHAHGMDVLVIKSQMKYFLWPSYGMKFSKEILEILRKTQLPQKTYIVHGMSLGAFVYTMLLMNYSMDQGKYPGFCDKIKLQILDSVVIGGLPKMIQGIRKSLTTSRFAEFMIQTSANLYFNLTKTYTVDFYNRALDYFENMPVKCPTLILYSHNDPMCDISAVGHLVDLWRKQGRHVVEKGWEQSRHAALILKPDYKTIHTDFLNHSQLVSKL